MNLFEACLVEQVDNNLKDFDRLFSIPEGATDAESLSMSKGTITIKFYCDSDGSTVEKEYTIKEMLWWFLLKDADLIF